MKKGYRKKLLKYEIFALFVLVAVVLDLAIVGISYATYTKNINNESEKICASLSEAIAASLNGNRVDDWLSGERMNEYNDGEEQLVNILDSYSDILNIRVLKMNLDGPRVVYDLSRARNNTELLGTTLEYSGGLSPIKNKLISGEYSGTSFTQHDNETVIVSMTPVTDVANNITCYAICEISMKTMKSNRANLIKTIFLAILTASIVLVIFLCVYINYSVVKPITKLDYELRKMTGCHKAEKVIEELELLKKRKLAEVTSICDGFIDILGDINRKDMEAENFEEDAKEKMLRAINKESSAEDLSQLPEEQEVVETKEKPTATPRKRIVKVKVKQKIEKPSEE